VANIEAPMEPIAKIMLVELEVSIVSMHVHDSVSTPYTLSVKGYIKN
jgi:hypothetical protein